MSQDDLVYHYCSIDTFMSIIRNKTLRFSDITKSNDSAEIRWISRNLESIFAEEFTKREDNSLKTAIEKPYLFDLYRKYIDFYFSYALIGKDRFFSFYTACFSRTDDMLSQWRGYADDGRGFSIGFSRELLKNHDPNEFKQFSINSAYVEYNTENQMNSIREPIVKLVDNIFRYIIPNGIHLDFDNMYFSDCFQEILEKAIFMKNEFFQEEQEWRMCFWTYKGFSNDNSILLIHNKIPESYDIEYQNRNNKIVSYFDLRFNPEIVKHVLLGPKNKSNISDLNQFLRMHGFNCAVDISKGTYI